MLSEQSSREEPQLTTRQLDELHAHPSYLRYQLAVSAAQLSMLAERDDLALQDPIVITPNGTIIDGYARVELARRQGRLTLLCLVYDLSDDEALLSLLQRHNRLCGLNDFSRIILALDLEPAFRGSALRNQQVGGRDKGRSDLTEAQRRQVRTLVAAAAGVSVGNVTKVKQILEHAHPVVLEALRRDEISIHRAWQWSSELPEKQEEKMILSKGEEGVKREMRVLIARHESKYAPPSAGMADLRKLLLEIESGRLGQVLVVVTKVAGKAVFLTEELFQCFRKQEELNFKCATKSY